MNRLDNPDKIWTAECGCKTVYPISASGNSVTSGVSRKRVGASTEKKNLVLPLLITNRSRWVLRMGAIVASTPEKVFWRGIRHLLVDMQYFVFLWRWSSWVRSNCSGNSVHFLDLVSYFFRTRLSF